MPTNPNERRYGQNASGPDRDNPVVGSPANGHHASQHHLSNREEALRRAAAIQADQAEQPNRVAARRAAEAAGVVPPASRAAASHAAAPHAAATQVISGAGAYASSSETQVIDPAMVSGVRPVSVGGRHSHAAAGRNGSYDAGGFGGTGNGNGGNGFGGVGSGGVGSDQGEDGKAPMSTKTKVLIAIGCFLAGLLVIGGVAAALFLNSINNSLGFQDEEEAQRVSEVLYTPEVTGDTHEPFYVLLMGSDSRADSASTERSDVLMLVRVDLDNATIHLISFPRDMMVNIEGYGTNKINAAHAYGGAALTISTVSEFAGVPISHYAEVSFEGLENLVDGIGGVYVNVPQSFQSNVSSVYLEAGEQWLNGEEALMFARERYNVTGGDFGRAQAQRMVVEAMIKQVLSLPATQLPGVVQELANCVTTDLSVSDIVDMALLLQGKELTIYSNTCPSYATSVDGVSYVCPMFNEFRDLMLRVDAGLDPDDEDAVIPAAQQNNSKLGAASNSPAPRDYYGLAGSLNYTNVVNPETGKTYAEEGTNLPALGSGVIGGSGGSANTGGYTDPDSGANSGTGSGGDAGSGTGSGSGGDSGGETPGTEPTPDSGTNPGTDPDSGSGSGSGSGGDSGSGSGPGGGVEPTPDPGVDPGAGESLE